MPRRKELRGGAPTDIDRSLKALVRRVTPVFFRLVGVEVDPRVVRLSNISVNLPEFRADQVFVVGEEGDPGRWAMHLEYQLQPDARVVRGWFLKNAALTAALDMPVLLTVIYLTRGRRRTFPKAYTASAGKLRTEFCFDTGCLWKHAEQIRSGELRELAPLLVLCEDKPTEQTLLEERELIRSLDVPE
ncbi:MAG TPA: hypothetical protein VK689_22735 [Armatimonadota bacterium]|nr:hypothetical protein [Armatimonadota bacterium]